MTATSRATGGAGSVLRGSGFVGRYAFGAGGTAIAVADASSTTFGAYSATAKAYATGGALGGAVGGASATASDLSGTDLAYALASGLGGAGSAGEYFGGKASGVSAMASGHSARAYALATGGAGFSTGGESGSYGGGGSAYLANAVTGSTKGGYLSLEQKSVGGAGPSAGFGGSGGVASSVLSFSDAVNPIFASSVTGTSIAIGGNGGGIYNGLGGNATSIISISGANAVNATADATGGTSTGYHINVAVSNANATSLAVALSNGSSGTAVSTASAAESSAVPKSNFNQIIDGISTATSTAITANGQLANGTASATGVGASTSASTALTNGTGLVSSVVASTLSTAVGTATTQAEVQSGSLFGFGGSAQSDYAYATSQPAGLPLTSDPVVAAQFESPSTTVVGVGWQGGYYISSSSGSQEYKNTTSFTLNTTSLSDSLVAGLLGSQTFGTGFYTLNFNIVVAGVTVLTQTFTTLAAAQTYFNDQVLNLGAVTPVAGLTVSFNLDLISGTANTGFGAAFVLGVTPPLVVAAPPTAVLTYGTPGAITGLSLSEAGAQAGETFTVTLSDTAGKLVATGTGISGAGSTRLTLAGSLAQVNADLATLIDTTTVPDSITIAATDSLGNSTSQTVAVTVRQANPYAVFSVLATLDAARQTVFVNADANDFAAAYAAGLSSGLVLNPATFPGDTASGSFANLVVPEGYSVGAVAGAGYTTIVVGNTSEIVTLSGGGASGGQTILASDSGLNFTSADATNTVLFSGGGNSNISFAGATGQDQIYLSAGNNTVTAGAGPTTIDAGIGANAITAGAGPTRIFVEGQDSITLGVGAAAIYVGPLVGEADGASAVVYGGDGAIYFQGGGAHANTVFGGASGNDTILAGAGGGVFFGGSGGNSLLEGGSGAVTLAGGGSGDYLVGSTAGADSLVAGSGNNVILYAQASNDTLVGGSGSAIYEIAGADTVHLRSGDATVAAGPGAGSSIDRGRAYVTAGSGNLLFYGGANASTVTAGAGSDTVFANAGGGVFAGGAAGGNILVGGASAVTLTAGGGTNYLQGASAGGDVLSAAAGANVTMVAIASGDTLLGGSGNDTIDALGADTVALGSGAATVQVGTGALVTGGTGSLYFVGGSAASTVQGGAGTETIFTGLGGGYFTAGSTGAPGGVNIIIATGLAATLVGASGSYLQGNAGATVANLLQAGAGNETLAAGLGADTLAGSTGTDVFSFLTAGANQTYSVTGFHVGDTLFMADQTTVTYALAHQVSTGSATTLSLADGSVIVVQGVSAPLTAGAFAHG